MCTKPKEDISVFSVENNVQTISTEDNVQIYNLQNFYAHFSCQGQTFEVFQVKLSLLNRSFVRYQLIMNTYIKTY